MNRETGKEKVNQDYSRREFIKATAFTVGAAGALSICGLAPAQAAGKSNELSLSVAGYKFDRTEALVFPTNTVDRLGADKWSAGPAAVALAKLGHWLFDALVQNVWSYAGDNDASDVRFFSFQYFINYNFESGWYLSSTPTITADWEADSDDRWTVPFGGGVDHLVKFGEQPVDLKLQGFYNVEKPKNANDWSLQFQVKLLFPKKAKEAGKD